MIDPWSYRAALYAAAQIVERPPCPDTRQDVAAAIRALPVPEGGAATEAEVERVARAIIAEMSLHLAMVVELSLHLDEGDPPDWAELGEGDRRAVMQVARAALRAARGQP